MDNKVIKNIMVSVVIPSYNSAHFLSDAIDSVLSQSFSDYEIIVVDDGSTDDTYSVITKYSHRIKYIYQENQGLPGARNTGILKSTGKYIALLDADDMFMQTHLEELVSFIDDYPQLGFVFADCDYFSSKRDNINTRFADSKIINIPYKDVGNDRRIFARSIFRELIWGSFIPNCTAVIRREVFNKCGLYDIYFKNCEDRELWLRIDRAFTCGYINHSLAKVRIHENNITHAKNSIKLLSYGKDIVSRKYLCSDISLDEEDQKALYEYMASVCFDLGWTYRRNNDYVQAFSYLKEGLYYDKFSFKYYRQLLVVALCICIHKIYIKSDY